MKQKFSKKFLLPAVLIPVLVLSLCGMLAVSAMERASSDKTPSNTAPTAYAGAMLNEKMYGTTHNRSRWLYDMMNTAGIAELTESTAEKVYETALAHDVIEPGEVDALYQPLDRRYAAQTLVKALHLPHRDPGELTDLAADDRDMATAVYYGYFLPDDDNMVFPEAQITADEYDALLEELSRCRLLKGKKILSFGDSIMYGAGNRGDGISDMLAAKYGMTCTDYSVSGSTLGVDGDRPHIADQLRQAFSDGETADIILLNGGTNDVRYTELGNITDGFNKMKDEETTMSGGLEKTLWILSERWPQTSVIYIRAHNMQLGDDTREQEYGDRAMEITEKWCTVTIDLYYHSDMNTEDPLVCDRYTAFSSRGTVNNDSIHPTAVGYSKFYLPPIAEELVNCFKE